MARLLRGFAHVWLSLAGALIFIGALAIWYTEGFGKVQEIFSPFNVVNFVAMIITVSPGIGALMLADAIEKRTALASQANIPVVLTEVEALVQAYVLCDADRVEDRRELRDADCLTLGCALRVVRGARLRVRIHERRAIRSSEHAQRGVAGGDALVTAQRASRPRRLQLNGAPPRSSALPE